LTTYYWSKNCAHDRSVRSLLHYNRLILMKWQT